LRRRGSDERCSAEDGDLESLIRGDVPFQQRRGFTAGGDGGLRYPRRARCAVLWSQRKGLAGARKRGDVRGTDKEISDLRYLTEFVVSGRAKGGAPACNLCSLAASLAWGKEGNGRGGRGLLIGVGYRRNGRGIKGNKGGGNPAGVVCVGVTAGA
jgi:hypothetical protein